MRYMNDYDLLRAERVARYNGWDNRLTLVAAVNSLRMWANANSDGWAYWPKPCRAAAKAMAEICGDGTNAADDRPDSTEAAVKAALIPIKAFLTRQGVDHAEVGL